MVSDDHSRDCHVSFGMHPGKRFQTQQTSLSNGSNLGASGFVGSLLDHYCDPGMGSNDE